MSREKSPAFQFYTKDWDSDINVIPMTYEEEGVYFALIRLLWNHTKLTSNMDELRLLLKGKPRLSQLQNWWKKIGKCFIERNGCLFHKRVERERRKQSAFRKLQSDKGKLGGRPTSPGKAAVKPELSSGKALLSASPSADQKKPQPLKRGSRRKGHQQIRAVISARDESAVEQFHESQRRRAEMRDQGMTPEQIETVFENEYIERKAATA